jgi:cell division protease FtsH
MTPGRRASAYVATFTIVVAAASIMTSRFVPLGPPSLSFSEFIRLVDAGQIARVHVSDRAIAGTTKGNERFQTHLPPDYQGLTQRLIDRRVLVDASASSPLTQRMLRLWTAAAVSSWAPTVLLIVMMAIIIRRLNGIERRLEDLAGHAGDGLR